MTSAHALPWPRIRPPTPSRPTQHPPQRYQGQSPWHDALLLPDDLQYTEEFDTGCHLGAGGATEAETSHDDDDDYGGRDDFTLMEGHGNTCGRAAGKGGCGGTTLEGARRRGGGRDRHRDPDDERRRRRRPRPFARLRRIGGRNDCARNRGGMAIPQPASEHGRLRETGRRRHG
ncbi:uncharacterized protein ARMOST_14174 [Armillaria ostoyae]|uniref:Uncharacterized protein n=1 Tax=Armillaria ostoyae TaxID=47428 RepID=A0A284RPU7_ARMOS|nr:uncharacterized protein ARMOST_14174 [Armillaria ostoyae]